MPKPFARLLSEGIPGPLNLGQRTRPRLIADNFQDAGTAATTINTQILQPLYGRVENLEKHSTVEVTVTTPNPASGLFPLTIPAPSFPVKTLALGYIRNNTTRAPETTVDTPQWEYTSSGALQITALTLTASTNYTLRFYVRG